MQRTFRLCRSPQNNLHVCEVFRDTPTTFSVHTFMIHLQGVDITHMVNRLGIRQVAVDACKALDRYKEFWYKNQPEAAAQNIVDSWQAENVTFGDGEYYGWANTGNTEP